MQKDLATVIPLVSASVDGCPRKANAETEANSEIARLRYAIAEVALEQSLRLIAPVVGRRPPALHQWPRRRDGSLEIRSLKSLKAHVAALRFEFVLCQLAWRERKAGFDENEPRRPKGEDGGGEWTNEGGDNGDSTPIDVPQTDSGPLRITIHPPSWYEGSTDGSGSDSESPPLGDPPEISDKEPATNHELFDFAKSAAWWAAKALAKEAANPLVGTLLNAIDAAYWGYKAAPYVRAYLDPPKTLDELKRAVSNPTRGYDIHHVVEKKAAKDARYPDHMINAPENLVRISALKHWQITGWYMKRNDRYGELSPREYLVGKDWAERTKVGLEALIKFGVLKP